MTDMKAVSVSIELTDQQIRDLQRFHETTEDDQGYDVSADRMKSLARAGMIRSLGFKRYEFTDAGSVVVEALSANPANAAHLTIPGALEWDGDNGTHGADGESRSHGESLANHSGDTNEKAEPAEEFPNCDYCGIIPDYHSWHGSGVINGTESPHIHACNECRHKLPAPISAYTAVDMTTAAADGFRDGQASANDSLKAFANEMIGAAFEGGSFDGGDIQAFGVKHGLLQVEQRAEECGEVCACREYGFPAECYRKTDLLKPAAPAKCESCGGWGHIETEDSAHDCPECGGSSEIVEDEIYDAESFDDVMLEAIGKWNTRDKRHASMYESSEAAGQNLYPGNEPS